MAKTGRRPGATQTRQQILDAARDQFAERGYTRVTLRSIAGAAQVHPALLHHYFGTKQALYAEALDLPVDPWEVLSRLLSDTPRDQLPAALVRHFVSTWRDSESGARLRARTRQTFGEADQTDMVRTHWESVLIPRFAQALDVPEINVAAALAHLVGLTLADTILAVRQLNSATDEDLVNLVTPALALYLTPDR